jgi:hypothetical protein
MANSHQNKTHVFYGQALHEENGSCEPEQKLWRAVLNQALVDAFEINTIWICDHEKVDVDNFFKTRTKEFDELCEKANLDPTRLWRKIQRLKGVKVGFLIPNKQEKNTLEIFNQFKERRKNYVQSHWRHNVG